MVRQATTTRGAVWVYLSEKPVKVSSEVRLPVLWCCAVSLANWIAAALLDQETCFPDEAVGECGQFHHPLS